MTLPLNFILECAERTVEVHGNGDVDYVVFMMIIMYVTADIILCYCFIVVDLIS